MARAGAAAAGVATAADPGASGAGGGATSPAGAAATGRVDPVVGAAPEHGARGAQSGSRCSTPARGWQDRRRQLQWRSELRELLLVQEDKQQLQVRLEQALAAGQAAASVGL